MARVLLSLALIMAVVIPIAVRGQSSTPAILIVELQTASLDSASDEFIEIFNPNSFVVPVEGWRIQYKSATGSDWLTKATLSGEMPSRSRWLFATSLYQATSPIASGLAGGGGHVRIADESDAEIDLVGWGSALTPETTAALAPEAGSSLKRLLDEDGFFIDTNDNLNDFIHSLTPTPQFDELPEPEAEPEPDVSPTNGSKQAASPSTPQASSASRSYLPVMITELFVDPDKPLTDAEDEFVELYNPNSSAVKLEDYVLQTGATYRYSFTLPNISLLPKTYLALFAADTNLTLSNTAGQARILSPNETVLDETDAYENAKAGKSWAKAGEQWSWSEPTPGRDNPTTTDGQTDISDRSELVLTQTQLGATEADDDNSDSNERTVYEDPMESNNQQLNNTVLAGVGSMAILYAGYEYRHDAGNRINQLRQYFKHRRQRRSAN